MAVKFRCTNLVGMGDFDGRAEDLGLCLVTKFTIDGLTIYSVIHEHAQLEERKTNDDEAIAEYGYKINYDTCGSA